MANTSNQKLKMLRILEILNKYTDEKHPLTADEIAEKLLAYNIETERKSVYRDINTLVESGVDIIRAGGKFGGYYIGDRVFDVAELKLLADAVSSSKFITEKKSRELIGKLEGLLSQNDAGMLQRQIVVTDRAKSENESILYSTDTIFNSINNNHKLSFKYIDLVIDKDKSNKVSRVERHNGDRYLVSPEFLVWNNENYYLVAYDEKSEQIKHYRVDRMIDVTEEESLRGGRTERGRLSMADFSQKTFSMFDGDDETVTLKCNMNMVGVIVDRFGREATIRVLDKETFSVRAKIKVSNQFFGWVTGLGGAVKIASPDRVANRYQEYLKEILNHYE